MCEIASLSETVGMRIPMLHSIFSSAKISFSSSIKHHIRVSRSDPRFNFVQSKCVLPNINARLYIFFRSPSINVLDCFHLNLIANSNNFKKYLIITIIAQ